MNDPELVFLDELSTGLDPQARRTMWDLVRSLRDQGKTVFLSTHFMEEAERLCDRVAIMDHGKIVALDTPENLISGLGVATRVVFTSEDAIDTGQLESLEHVSRVETSGDRIIVHGQGDRLVSDVVRAVEEHGWRFRDLRSEQPTLDDVFLTLTAEIYAHKRCYMRGVSQLIVVQFKLFYREPAAFFFTLVFPMLLLLVFGSLFGGQVIEDLPGNFKVVDAMVPAYTALIIGSSAFMGIPTNTASARETKVLRRFRATPISPLTYLTAEVVVFFAMTLVGMALLILVGIIVYDLRFGGFWLSMLGGFALCTGAFFAVGYVVASVSPTARVATTVGMGLFFPQIFLSGVMYPTQLMPELMRQISQALPMTYAVELLQGLWFGFAWGDRLDAVVILGGMLVIGTALAVKTFRWE